MSGQYITQAQNKMKDNIEAFRSKVRKIRTGRANPSLLDSIQVPYYGSLTALSKMASISSPSPKTLLVSPWDSKTLKEIEQALAKANMGVNPQNDGKVIRLILPDLTEERRKDLVKEVKKEAEKCRVDLRNNRRLINEEIKKAVKEKQLSEDEQKHLNNEIQKIIDDFMDQVEQVVQTKEKEILEL